MKTKAEIREAMKAWRQALDASWVRSASASIAQHVFVLEAYRSAAIVCLFATLPGEVILEAVRADCRRRGKRLLLPAYCQANQAYGFKEWHAGESLRRGHCQVLEPDTEAFAELRGNVLILVPGLAFDVEGGRIGYGAGYYDRLLASAAEACEPVAAGICFEAQVHAVLPQEHGDRRMDFVVTEKQARDCRLIK